MPAVTRQFIQSMKRKETNSEQKNTDMNLLERLLSVQDTEMSNRGRKERTRKITLVGNYPKYLAQSLKLSDLPKYDPDDRIWRESRSDVPELSQSRRHDEFPSFGTESSRKISHYSDWTADDKMTTQKQRPLRLPPIILPRVCTMKPTPLQPRYFFDERTPRGPITDEEWEDLQECRYLRPGLKKFKRTWVS